MSTDYRTFGARAAGALDSYFAGAAHDDPTIALDVLLHSLRTAAADCGIELRDGDAANAAVEICWAGKCDRPAQPEHSPCCSSAFHLKPLCCEHYCRSHFVERNQCSPSSHAAAMAAGAR